MKNKFKVLLMALVLVGNIGCGDTSSSSKPYKSTLLTKYGVDLVSNAQTFSGSFVANVDCGLMLIKISSPSYVTMTCEGVTKNERLVKNDRNEFFITDTEFDSLMAIKKTSTGISISDSDGSEILFISAGN